MSEPTAAPDQVMRALVTEAKRIHEDALFCCAGHTREARYWNAVQLWLGIPSAVLAALAGVTSLAGSESATDILGAERYLITGVLSLMAAALVGLMTFLDPKGQASKHYGAMTGYQALLSRVRIFYEIGCQHRRDVETLTAELQKLAEQLSEMHKQTPMISAGAAALAERAIRAGKYAYAVDRGGGKPQRER